jgi:hypothetical protein
VSTCVSCHPGSPCELGQSASGSSQPMMVNEVAATSLLIVLAQLATAAAGRQGDIPDEVWARKELPWGTQ